MTMSRFFSLRGAPIPALAGIIAGMAGPPAWAADADGNLAAIRNEIMQLKQDYENKIKDLEDRLAKAEADAQAAKTAAAAAQTAAMAAEAAPAAAAANAPAFPPPSTGGASTRSATASA